jgi:hypothetical protein
MVDPNVVPVWKDRWYNPGYIDPNTAMFVSTPLSGVIMDIDSEMTFDAGVYYKYFHVGNVQNETIVSLLTANSGLRLHLDNWSARPTDESIFANTTTVVNYDSNSVTYDGVNKAERPTDTALNLDGIDQYAQTLYDPSFVLDNNISTSFWAYAKDWSNMAGSNLVSKDHRGGWNVKYNNGFFNPNMTFLDNTGKMIIMNVEGHVINSKHLPQPSNPTCTTIDENLFTWVSDNAAKKVYKIDYNGDLIASIDFDTTTDLNTITLGSELLWVADTNTNTASSFDIFTNKLSTIETIITTGFQIQNMTIDLNSNIQCTSGTQILVDNDNSVWMVQDSTVYKGTSAVITGNSIGCDKDNYIWVLFGTNSFLKMDSTTFAYTSGTVGDNSTPTDRAISFTSEYIDDIWQTFTYFTYANEQKIYKTDSNGNLIKFIDISVFDTYPMLNNFTSYDWNRKFNYLKYNKTPQIQTEVTFIDSLNQITRKTCNIPCSAVANNNWHLFTFTVEDGTVKFYMDALLRDTKSLSTDNTIYYEYENPLLIGTNVGKITTLAYELNLNQMYFKGKIDDLRIYNTVLNNSDIRYIYLNKFDYHELIWNMATGNQNYLEEISRFFKFKLPGLKSQYYNIRINGLQISDSNTRIMIENIIKDNLKKIVPSYAELFKIIWE